MRKRYLIIGLLLAAIVIIGGIYAYSKYEQAESIKESKVKVDHAGVEVVKSALNIYYVFYGEYPRDIDDLTEGLSDKSIYERLDSKPYDIAKFKEIVKELNDFEYSVRGDKRAYQFNYTDQYGERKTVKGEYQKEFH